MADTHADGLPRYPAGAGYRDDDASRDGARKVNEDGSRVSQCDFALRVIDAAGAEGITAYGVLAAPGATFRDLSTCRARISNLLKDGRVAKKGERVPGEAGISVNLWIAARFAPKSDDEGGQGNLFGSAAA